MYDKMILIRQFKTRKTQDREQSDIKKVYLSAFLAHRDKVGVLGVLGGVLSLCYTLGTDVQTWSSFARQGFLISVTHALFMRRVADFCIIK